MSISKLNLTNNEVWIMYSSENSDPYFSKFITDKTIVPSAAVLSKENSILFVHELDKENVKNFFGDVIVYDSETSIIKNIEKILEKLQFPQTIYLNYSDRLDSQTDVLGHGTFRFLSDNISKFYKIRGTHEPRFFSADEIIYFLLDSKTDEDIKYLKIAANRALEILNTAFRKIRPGMSEKTIANLVHNIFKQKPSYFKKFGIISEDFSWEKETCPIVLVGENLQKGGHSAPSDKILKRGDTVYFDFGVKITLKNGKSYSSDLQRMGYVLMYAEKIPPKSVTDVFNTLTCAIQKGIENMFPHKKGFEIDEIVRNFITKKGYPNYNHATGHPIGENAHNPGTSISPKGYKRSEMEIRENGVYTIEPRIQIPNGGSIEEMIMVTKNGGVPLCAPQKSLYLIK